MTNYQDSLRGYGRKVFERDKFKCTYCGTDHGSFAMWRFLTVDHLLPHSDQRRDELYWQVTACSFCNTAGNRTTYLIDLNTTPEDIIEQKKVRIEETYKAYLAFWDENYGEHSSTWRIQKYLRDGS